MIVAYEFTETDFAEINRCRTENGQNALDFDEIRGKIEQYLQEMGISSAGASLIRNTDGDILWGSERLPILIGTKDRVFIVKPYDDIDSEREKGLLKVVQGRIAPKVYFYGSTFYAEEFIDPAKAQTLESMADKGQADLGRAVEIGGEMHGELANLGINYNHRHWLDEFHLLGERRVITDFGTARFFLELGASEYFDELYTIARDEGVETLLTETNIIPCFDPSRLRYQEVKAALCSLEQDHVRMVNLLYAIKHGASGISEYVERIPARVRLGYANYSVSEQWTSGWNMAMEVFPKFVEGFTRTYNPSHK